MTTGAPGRSQALPEHRYVLVLIAAMVLICWLIPTLNPLWLDEAGTYWIVKDGPREVFERSYYWTNPSPYYLAAWLAEKIGGTNEVVLRLPSLIAMGIAAFLVSRIGKRLVDRETGMISAAIFVVIHEVAHAAADARPYAFTLMLLLGSVLALLHWLESGRARHALALVFLTALTAYGHAVLALALAGPWVYVLWRTRRRLELTLLAAASVLLLVPLAIQTRAYLGMDTVHVFGERPVLSDFWSTIAPAQIVATTGGGLLLAFLTVPGLRIGWGMSRPHAALLGVWLTLAPAVLFILARTTSLQLYHPRYLLSVMPAMALLTGAFVRGIQPAFARQVVLSVVVLASVITYVASARFHHGEDWPGAMHEIRRIANGSEMTVLTPSCFVEAQTPASLDDARIAEALFAPLLVYPPPPIRVVRLPYVVNERHLSSVVGRELIAQHRFIVLGCGETESSEWVRAWAGSRGFTTSPIRDFRGLKLREFRR